MDEESCYCFDNDTVLAVFYSMFCERNEWCLTSKLAWILFWFTYTVRFVYFRDEWEAVWHFFMNQCKKIIQQILEIIGWFS